MTNPNILKENKLIIEGYKAKENARQDGVLICTDSKNKTFEFVKVRNLPYGDFTIGEYLDMLENIISANYEEILSLIKSNQEITNQAILSLADKMDKEKFL